MAVDAEGNEIVTQTPEEIAAAEKTAADTAAAEKTAADKVAADKAAADKAAADAAAKPVKYDLKLAEKSALTKDDLERIAGQALEQGLTQEQAQKRLSDEEAIVGRVVEAREAKDKATLDAEYKRWIETGKADPEIGGDKYAESAELAKRVVDKFGTEELKKSLETSHLGDYHEFVRLLSRIGRAMDSDKLVIGDTKITEPKSIAERLYGSNTKKKE